MKQHRWSPEGGLYIVCVDSYHNCVLQGRILSPHWEEESFSSLAQFLVKMEQMLDHIQMPQAFTEPRRFSRMLQPELPSGSPGGSKGSETTFELRIFFRQHTSWQGILLWKEKRLEHNFRSVLELVILMDSALRSIERSGCV